MEVIHQLPHPALTPYVRAYWAVRQALPPGATLRVPFGCTGRTHWMITLQNTFESRVDATNEPLAIYRSTLVGQHTQPLTHYLTTTNDVLLVDFTATGLHTLWPVAVNELAGRNVDSAAGMGPDTAQIAEQLLNTPTQTDRFARLDTYLLRRLGQAVATDGRVEAAVQLIQQQPGRWSVTQLAGYLNCTERTLSRRFTEAVGLSPKLYARVQRFLQVKQWFAQHPTGPWHELPAALGYYDQAHLIHEFRHFAGTSPRRYGTADKPLLDVVQQA